MQSDLGWPKVVVDRNMRTKVAASRLRITPYDKTSIMHYYFGPEQQILRNCEGSPDQATDKGACQIAADALQLVISVEPK